ncbi:MAG: hypothetical protein AAGB07_11905, partial [Pseudomonadota bacterium]
MQTEWASRTACENAGQGGCQAAMQAAESDKASIEKQISQLDRKFDQTADGILDIEDEVTRKMRRSAWYAD